MKGQALRRLLGILVLVVPGLAVAGLANWFATHTKTTQAAPRLAAGGLPTFRSPRG